MVRTSTRKSNGRSVSRRPVRSAIRTMARAISAEPNRFRPPIDPPAVTRTYIFNHIIETQIKIAATTGFDPNLKVDPTGNSAFFGCALDATRTTINICRLKIMDLYTLWNAYARIAPISVDEVEIAICKLTMWGAADRRLAGQTISCMVDNLAPYSSQITRDTGSLTSRAKCGITLPFRCWYPSKSTQEIIRVDPDCADTLVQLASHEKSATQMLAEGLNLGTVHISLSVKLSAQ